MRYFKSYEPIDKSGAVAWSDYIEADQVIEAYNHGVFPWPDQEKSIYWFSPLRRGVLDFKDLHWSKSDLKFFKDCKFQFKMNQNFVHTIETCAKVKNEIEDGTWITEDLINAYIELNQMGVALSFEVYDEGSLIGGMYGVLSKTYFSAESMFYLKSNASKFALYKSIDYFKSIGLSWIDTQVTTDFTSRLGAKEISRAAFLKRIS